MSWQPPPPPPRPSGAPSSAGSNSQSQQTNNDLTLYQLLQVDRDAHPTIMRYAYRFLAAMYHPDNGETGNADKFRVISDAFRTLSDEGKRQAYDMSLGAKEHAGGGTTRPKERTNEFGREMMPNIPKTGLSWNEVELRLAILQVLLAARKKRPNSGGASGRMLMDCLNIDNIAEIEFALWYLREKGLIEVGERVFLITVKGLDHLIDQLSKTQMLDGVSKTEEKFNTGVQLPATLT